MRLNLMRNDKELQALGHEVESLKENNQRLEGEVLTPMEAAEPRAARIKELTELIARQARGAQGGRERDRGPGRGAQDVDQRQRVERDR